MARLTPTEIEAIRKRLDEDVNTNDGEETAVAYVQAFRDRRALLSDRDAGAWRPISEAPTDFQEEAQAVGREICLGQICKKMMWSDDFESYVIVTFHNTPPCAPQMYFVLPAPPSPKETT